MSDRKINRPPAGGGFYWVTDELAASDAWRTLIKNPNSSTLVNFLLREHMGKGGRKNGELKAPYQQLEQIGIGARHVSAAIRKAEELGLIDCHRNGRRVDWNATCCRVTMEYPHQPMAGLSKFQAEALAGSKFRPTGRRDANPEIYRTLGR